MPNFKFILSPFSDPGLSCDYTASMLGSDTHLVLLHISSVLPF